MKKNKIITLLVGDIFKLKKDILSLKEQLKKFAIDLTEANKKVFNQECELKELYNVIQGKDQEISSLKDTNKELNAENSQLSADFEAYKLKSC